MTRRRKLHFGVLALLALGIAIACGDSGVVGGDCASGYLLCDGRCIDPDTDPRHCGSCGNACGSGVACIQGECETGGSGGADTGGSAGAAGETGSGGSVTSGGSGGSGGSPATGGSGGSGGSGASSAGGSGGFGGSTTSGAGSGGEGGAVDSGGTGGEACVPPFDSPAQCGDCDTACPSDSPLCEPTGPDTYECVPMCSDGLVQCDEQCVDVDVDPLNCGRCDKVCPSGVCVDGSCVGVTPGHVVYICMDYAQVFQVSAQTTLLGNAVFLSRQNPVRVLAYGKYAEPAVMASVDRAIRWAATSSNRSVNITRVNSVAAVESDLELSNYDVLLVYDQPLAATGELASEGTELAPTLESFTQSGGVVVVLSSGTGEMDDFASDANLASIGTESDYTGELAYNQASGDVVGLGVVTPFLTLANSCTFETSETPSGESVFVVTDTPPSNGLGEPIVLHKVVTP